MGTPPRCRSSHVLRGPTWVPKGRCCQCSTPQRHCLRPGVDSALVVVVPRQSGRTAAGLVLVDEWSLMWGGMMPGPTVLQGSTRCGVSTKGLMALPQPGQVLVGPWGTRDVWGDVTAARMRAVGPGPAQGLGDGIQLEPSWSWGDASAPHSHLPAHGTYPDCRASAIASSGGLEPGPCAAGQVHFGLGWV